MKKIFVIIITLAVPFGLFAFTPTAYSAEESMGLPTDAEEKEVEEDVKIDAEYEKELKESFDEFAKASLTDDCLTEDEMLNATIIEEAFLTAYKEDEAGKKTRICERVTFCATLYKKEFCRTELQKSCPETGENSTVTCQRVQAIFGSGTQLVANYVGLIYRWAASLVGIIAVLIIIASGIQIAAAGGDSAKVESAKNRIVQSLAGLVLLFLASLILYSINPNFFT